jgi:hypothetical protein
MIIKSKVFRKAFKKNNLKVNLYLPKILLAALETLVVALL